MQGGLRLPGQAGFAEERFSQADTHDSMQASCWRLARQLGVLNDIMLGPLGGLQGLVNWRWWFRMAD